MRPRRKSGIERLQCAPSEYTLRPMALTRRGFLGSALATALPAQAKLKIVSVKAYPVTLSKHFAARAPKFSSDYDPARWRWLGKLSNLAGEIVVEIRTD